MRTDGCDCLPHDGGALGLASAASCGNAEALAPLENDDDEDDGGNSGIILTGDTDSVSSAVMWQSKKVGNVEAGTDQQIRDSMVLGGEHLSLTYHVVIVRVHRLR